MYRLRYLTIDIDSSLTLATGPSDLDQFINFIFSFTPESVSN